MATTRKSVLITGCSTAGIGAGLAEVFQEKGYHVFATARNLAMIPPTLSKAPNVTVLKLDVLSSEMIAAAVESVSRETGGTLDVLINNSGGGYFEPALDTNIERAKEVFDLNFWAPLAMVKAFSPLLIKAQGYIVNNTSVNSIVPIPFMSVYNASKAALSTAGETWRLELEPLGVRTITLITLGVKTEAFSDYRPVELPESSHYIKVQDFMNRYGDGRMQKDAIDTKAFATTVFRAVDKGATGMVWAGSSASILRFAWWISPQFVRDMLVQSIIPIRSEMAKHESKKQV